MTKREASPVNSTLPQSMRACVLHGVRRLEVREIPTPEMGPQDVLVRVTATGLCGTDVHIFEGTANYHTNDRGQLLALATHPQILGHEIAGIIVQAGAAVRDLSPGDRVVLDQGLNCVSRGRQPMCEYCLSEDSHQCEFYAEHGITGLQGGLADYLSLPAVNAVHVDSDLEPAQAAISEPLACIIHSLALVARAKSARYALGPSNNDHGVRSALVIGAGPAGLLFVQYLRCVLGFNGLLLVSEPNARKRALAEHFGAEVIDPTAEDLVSQVIDRTSGRLVEFVIESSGAGQVFSLIPRVLRKQGTVLLYSHGQTGVELNLLNALQFKEPTLVSPVGGSGGFDDDGRPSVYRRALRLIEQGEIKVSPFISHRYQSLSDVNRAFTEDFHRPDYIKGVVELS